MSNLQEIFDRVQQKLDEAGLSADAASDLAKRPDAIRNLKRALTLNRRGISTDTLIALAPVLKTSASWLLEGGPEDRPNAIDEAFLLDLIHYALALAQASNPLFLAQTILAEAKGLGLPEGSENRRALSLARIGEVIAQFEPRPGGKVPAQHSARHRPHKPA